MICLSLLAYSLPHSKRLTVFPFPGDEVMAATQLDNHRSATMATGKGVSRLGMMQVSFGGHKIPTAVPFVSLPQDNNLLNACTNRELVNDAFLASFALIEQFFA